MTHRVLPPTRERKDYAVVSDLQGHTFGSRLKRAREKAGLSQEALAEAIGVVRRTVAAYEAGTKSPRLDRLTTIAQVLEKPPGWFLQSGRIAAAASKLDQVRLEVRQLRHDVRRLAKVNDSLAQRLEQLCAKLA